MKQWNNIASVVALSISTAIAGTGCLAQDAGDEAANEPGTAPAAQETTGEAQQACGCGVGIFPGACAEFSPILFPFRTFDDFRLNNLPGFGTPSFGWNLGCLGGCGPTGVVGVGAVGGIGGFGGCW